MPQPVAAMAPPIMTGPAIGASQRLNDTFHGIPTAPPASLPGRCRPSTTRCTASRPPDTDSVGRRADARADTGAVAPLASLLIRGGALKGKRLPVRAPVVNIGRADYNDIVLPEASVSTAHAKLQRREGVWVISDLESTNGTTVDGEPVNGRVAPLARRHDPLRRGRGAVRAHGCLVDAHASGTRVMQRIDVPAPPPPAAPAPPTRTAARRAPSRNAAAHGRQAPPKSSVSTWALVLFVVLAAVAAALVFLR